MQPDDDDKKKFAEGGQPLDDTSYRRVSVVLTTGEPLRADQLADVLLLLDDETGGRHPDQLQLGYHELLETVPGFSYKLLALRLARTLALGPDLAGSSYELLLRPECQLPFYRGYCCRAEGWSRSAPGSVRLAERATWEAGWDVADRTPAGAVLDQLHGILRPGQLSAVVLQLGDVGCYPRDLYAYRRLSADILRRQADEVPVITVPVGGEGEFTAALADRLAFESLPAFLRDAGVLGEDDDPTEVLGDARCECWPRQRYADLPEWGN